MKLLDHNVQAALDESLALEWAHKFAKSWFGPGISRNSRFVRHLAAFVQELGSQSLPV